MKFKTLLSVVVVPGALALSLGTAFASSHSDAPLIKQDPQANLTDVYAFVGNNAAHVKVLNVVVAVRPFMEPGDGVIYDRFADDAQYSIHITNPTTGQDAYRYDFQFSPVSPLTGGMYKNLDTILSYGRGTAIGAIMNVGDAQQNFLQIYKIRKTISATNANVTVTTDSGGHPLMCPPPNVGKRTTPLYNDADGCPVSGATTPAGLDHYTAQTVYNLTSGETAFAGPRDDGFYCDIPGIFDLLDPRILGPDAPHGQTGNGTDGFKGYNVLNYSLQIPLTLLDKTPGFPKVGVYASVARPHTLIRNSNGIDTNSIAFTQVDRLGNPFFNEALVALRDKDLYNRLTPLDDATRFKKYALTPELPVLINTVFGTSFQTTNRTDLVGIFIPDVLRVDTSTEPVRLPGQAGYSRLSFIGGDTTTNGSPGGWPNGRRLGDDVMDITLTALASGPSFQTITIVGDNVNANDEPYNAIFPYSATPHSGTNNYKDPGPNGGFTRFHCPETTGGP